MLLTNAENVVEYGVPFYYLFTLLPIIIIIASPPPVISGSTITNNQYLVYRTHQIDTPNGQFGSRSSVFNLEALTPGQIPDFFIRKCALFKWKDLLKTSYNVFVRKILQDSLVSGVLVIFDNLSQNLTNDEMNIWQSIEKKLLTNETSLPIYFIEENDDINRLYDELKQPVEKSKDASIKDLFAQNVLSDSYQLVVNGPQVTPVVNPIVTSFQTKLIGAGIEDQMPTYAIVSHYDSYSIVPALSYGADSNASGLIVFLELLRIFSKLYSNVKTRPKANMIFLLSGGGKLNYFGTKKWLEEHLDSTRSSSSSSDSLFENIQFALCLESLADTMNENGLFMYVSKPPKTGARSAIFWDHVQDIAKHYYPTINTTLVHKKINLAEDYLFWEHERFSLRRMPAFTLTSLSTSKLIKRTTLIDLPREKHLDHMETYINIIGESLVRQLYGTMNENLLTSEFAVSRPFIKSLTKQISKLSRAQNLLFTLNKDQHYQLPSLLKSIHLMMKKYSDNNVNMFHFKVDPKNPEFTFYEPVKTKMFIYKTKPAIFDLFITCFVVIYLIIFFLVVKYYNYLIMVSKFLNFEKELHLKIKTK